MAIKKRKRRTKIRTIEHFLVPKHVVLKQDKEQSVLDRYNITKAQLPLIWVFDPAIQELEAKGGDIIEITNVDGKVKNVHYRIVVE